MHDLMTARCTGPVITKQAQIITPPPPCLTVVSADMLSLVLPKSCGLIRCKKSKRYPFCLFFLQKRLSPDMLFLFSLLLVVSS